MHRGVDLARQVVKRKRRLLCALFRYRKKDLHARQMEATQPCVADNVAVISCASCPLRNNVTVWQCRVIRPSAVTRDTPSYREVFERL
jgi:hypothetical protein